MLSILTNYLIHKSFRLRYDGNPKLRYENAADYGCSAKKFEFRSGDNILRGEKVFFGDIASCKEAIVFFHGAGAGHTAYEKEIAFFAKRGYLVYAYDNTGCMESEGKEVGNLAQSVWDAEAFFDYLKSDEDFKGRPIYAIGHSWGGLALTSCLREDCPVSKCVSLSGLVDLSMLYLYGGKLPNWMKSSVQSGIRREYGKKVADLDRLLMNAKKPFKYYVGMKIPLIIDSGTAKLVKQISLKNSFVSYAELEDKGHNCYWAAETESYFRDLLDVKNYLSLSSDPSIELDLSKIKDDPLVMESVIDFLKA